jgi:hypothetical protein
MTYESKRPHIPAEIKRQVMTEAGHQCSVTHCSEHIVEIHHINENREDNRVDNLIVLCDKNNKLAHNKNITRKELHEYKRKLLVGEVQNKIYSYNEHDLNLLRSINDNFSYDIIQRIQHEPFGSCVPQVIFESIDKFIYNSEDPLNSFNDHGLENLRKESVSKARDFTRYFCQQSAGGPNGNYRYININEILMHNPNADISVWEEKIYETQRLAQVFCDSILNLRGEMKKI